jgi:hypothetical protein
MKGSTFISTLQNQLKMSRNELASVLGKQPAQLSAMKNLDISALTVARMIKKLNGEIVRGVDLADEVKEKLGATTDAETAFLLGMSMPALGLWKRRKTGITSRQICNAIASTRERAKEEAHASAFRPIIEFFPIKPFKQSTKFCVFDDEKGKNKQRAGLRAELSASSGLYIFYDTRGKALYIGKAVRQDIWKEMNLAFNRARSAQNISLVKHPINNVKYVAASEKIRQPIDTPRKLVDLAAYFSAYAVSDSLIDNFEALFIRAFPNDLLNYRMEKVEVRSKIIKPQ